VLAFHPDVLQAVQNPSLSEPQRYALRRMAELLGDGTHLTQSAYFMLDPIAVTDDLRQVLDAFARAADPLGYDQAIRVVRDAQRWLVRDRNGKRFYGTEYTSLSAALSDAAKLLGQVPPTPKHPSGTPSFRKEVRNWRSQQLKAKLPGMSAALDAYRVRAAGTAGGYRARLAASVRLQMRGGLPNERAWTAFDHDLTSLAAATLAQGRHGPSLVAEIAEAFQYASTVDEAERRFFAALRPRARDYEVAFAVDGLRASTSQPMHNCEFATLQPRWRYGVGHTHAQLRAFVRPRRNDRCDTLLTRVTAADAGQARERVVRIAEGLIAELTAANRVSQLLLRREMLVLDIGAGRVYQIGFAPAGLSRPDRLGEGRIDRLTGPMHYAALARSEPSSVIALVQTWIALVSPVLSSGLKFGIMPHGTNWTSQSGVGVD
jgi:hypothetical protein